MGTFGRLVFCAVRTQIVGKTKFFDSLNTARKSGVFLRLSKDFDSLSLETTLSSEY